MMDVIQEYFTCDQCDCKDFKLIYNFSLKFHNINFSDDLIYDRTVDGIQDYPRFVLHSLSPILPHPEPVYKMP